MTLFDRSAQRTGKIVSVGGSGDTHRRLVDMGLIGSTFKVRARTKRSVLAEFGVGFAAAVSAETAGIVQIIETVGGADNENRTVRKSERRKDDAF